MNEKGTDKLSRFENKLEHEATLHWQRNNYFLLTMNLFLLSLSQFNVRLVVIIIGFFGLLISIVWLLVNHRSSDYIGYYKQEIQKYKEEADLYSDKIRGIQIRHLSYFLPIIFILLWSVLEFLVLCLQIELKVFAK
jgi:hypothetical protein